MRPTEPEQEQGEMSLSSSRSPSWQMRHNTPEDPLLPERDSLAQSDKFEEENVDDKAAMGGLSGILGEEIGLKKEAVHGFLSGDRMLWKKPRSGLCESSTVPRVPRLPRRLVL